MKKEIKFSGVGIHSGKTVNVRVLESKRPGIWFRRVDLPFRPFIRALWNNVSNTGLMSTTIGKAPKMVQTIEHFMAALFISGINDAIVEIDGPEFPIMDGGAKKFIELFKKSGFENQGPDKRIIVKKEIFATRQEIVKQMPFAQRFMLWLHGLKTGRREDGSVKLSPDNRGFVLDITLDYPDAQIGKQRYEFLFDGSKKSRESFEKNISKSRTFGRFWEWEYLKKRGMGKGATGDNLIVLMNGKDDWEKAKAIAAEDKNLKEFMKNKGAETLAPLHYDDEFVRHKLIDAVGDMFLSGGFVIGRMESCKGSHGLNNLVLKKLFSDPSNYDIV